MAILAMVIIPSSIAKLQDKLNRLEESFNSSIQKLTDKEFKLLMNFIDIGTIGLTASAALMAGGAFTTAFFTYLSLDYTISYVLKSETSVDTFKNFCEKKLLEVFEKPIVNKIMSTFNTMQLYLELLYSPAKGISNKVKQELNNTKTNMKSTIRKQNFSGINSISNEYFSNLFLPPAEYKNTNRKIIS